MALDRVETDRLGVQKKVWVPLSASIEVLVALKAIAKSNDDLMARVNERTVKLCKEHNAQSKARDIKINEMATYNICSMSTDLT